MINNFDIFIDFFFFLKHFLQINVDTWVNYTKYIFILKILKNNNFVDFQNSTFLNIIVTTKLRKLFLTFQIHNEINFSLSLTHYLMVFKKKNFLFFRHKISII